MLVVDTGVLYAVADAGDADHEACDSLLADEAPGELMVPVPVIVESAWLIESRLGARAEAAFIASVVATELTAVDLLESDWRRVHELVETYADLQLGLVDASVVAIAERFGLQRVATLNRRDFTVVRPRHVAALELLP